MKFGLVSIICIGLYGCAVQPQGQISQKSVYYLPLVQSDAGPKDQKNIQVQHISDQPKYSTPVKNGTPVTHSTYSPVIQ